MIDILVNLNMRDTQLVDNDDFLTIMNTAHNDITYPGEPDISPSPFGPEIMAAFYSPPAEPFVEVKDLMDALRNMFGWRYTQGLEEYFIPDFAAPPNTSMCSSETD